MQLLVLRLVHSDVLFAWGHAMLLLLDLGAVATLGREALLWESGCLTLLAAALWLARAGMRHLLSIMLSGPGQWEAGRRLR